MHIPQNEGNCKIHMKVKEDSKTHIAGYPVYETSIRRSCMGKMTFKFTTGKVGEVTPDTGTMLAKTQRYEVTGIYSKQCPYIR